jgi:hypothetical protein
LDFPNAREDCTAIVWIELETTVFVTSWLFKNGGSGYLYNCLPMAQSKDTKENGFFKWDSSSHVLVDAINF